MSKCRFDREVYQIGYFKSAAILSRRGDKLAPEQWAYPNFYGQTSREQYRGMPYVWTYQELFGHVKSQGYTNPRMI